MVRAKKAHQATEATARVAIEMALEMEVHANTRLGISSSVAKAMLMLKREEIISSISS
jgi:hypothetical protein